MRKIDVSNLVGLEAFEGGTVHKKFVRESLKQRVEILKHLTKEDVGKIVELIGGEVVDFKLDESTDWVVMVKPFKGFEIYYLLQRGEPEFEDQLTVLFSKESLNWKITAEDVSDFVILYANVLIYAAKKIRKDLPKLGVYL